MFQLYIIVHTSLMQEKAIIHQFINGPLLDIQEKMKLLTENVSRLMKDMYEIQQERQKLNNKDDTISHIRLNFNNNHQKVNHKSKLLSLLNDNETGWNKF